ncbi:MAG: hypothetical protein V8S76_07130 [Lachnospiraceae bacterium]
MLLGGGSLNGVRVMNQATVDYFTDGGLTRISRNHTGRGSDWKDSRILI